MRPESETAFGAHIFIFRVHNITAYLKLFSRLDIATSLF